MNLIVLRLLSRRRTAAAPLPTRCHPPPVPCRPVILPVVSPSRRVAVPLFEVPRGAFPLTPPSPHLGNALPSSLGGVALPLTHQVYPRVHVLRAVGWNSWVGPSFVEADAYLLLVRLSVSALRRLVREELDLGKVVFSPRRRDGAPTGERDTPEEAKLYGDLESWVVDVEGSAALAARLRSLMDSPRYSDFFHAPPGDVVVYRGLTNLRPEQLRRWMAAVPGGDETWKAMMAGDDGWKPCRITLRPKDHGMMSWSRDEEVATETFADPMANEEGRVSVVFSAAVAGAREALDLSRITTAVDGLAYAGTAEGEVVTFGPVVTSRIRMMARSPEDDGPF